MALTGTLRTWHDDRGFGFIAPRDGGREVFVHISAFPRDGTRPTVGEVLAYELGTGPNGKPQAVRVVRQALGRPAGTPATQSAPVPRPRPPQPRRGLKAPLILVLVAVLGVYAYRAYQQRRPAAPLATLPAGPAAPATTAPTSPTASAFRCDGRTHCSQMTSCAEAKYFLQHCPGVQMDGNHDGVPCEQQWCTGSTAR